jgi:class 3 adenylate cyclase
MTKKESGKYSKYHGPATEGADSSELVDLQTLFTQRQDRLANALKERYQYNISIKRSQEFSVKVGIDEGENVVVQYEYDQRSPIDILGYRMNVAAKITEANGISVGENVFKPLHSNLQSEFHELITSRNDWKYVDVLQLLISFTL